MKAKERHDLKQNDFAETTGKLLDTISENGQRVGMIAGAVVIVAVIAGGVLYWRKHTADQAGAALGIATAIQQAQVAPTSTLPGATQTPNTYPTEKARDEAALKSFQDVAAAYPSTDAGMAASFQAASELMALGRFDDAEQGFRKVADSAGSSIYGPMAKMGSAEALFMSGKYDQAIKAFGDLAADRDSALPVDGVLMQLAKADMKANKSQDAKAALKRVVDEFPDSAFTADARQQLAALD